MSLTYPYTCIWCQKGRYSNQVTTWYNRQYTPDSIDHIPNSSFSVCMDCYEMLSKISRWFYAGRFGGDRTLKDVVEALVAGSLENPI